MGIVVDSGAALEEQSEAGLAVVSLHVQVGGRVLDGSLDSDVYDRLRRGEQATTSTPSPGDYATAIDGLPEGLDAVVILTIPRQFSGMHDSALLAARMHADRSAVPAVHVVETPTAAAGYGLIARIAWSLAATGADTASVLARVRTACADVQMYGALATLEYVARSGRVPSLVAGVSDALKVRPVFEMREGGTARVALARTESGVLRALERVARERLNHGTRQWLMLFHAAAQRTAEQLERRLLATVDAVYVETVALAPVLGVHTGPGAVGFAAIPVRDGDPAGLA